MNIKEAQSDMRSSYLSGSTGILSSGVIWIVAGLTAIVSTSQTSVIVFFFGGMLIHPLSILISKIMKRSGKHQPDNPLATLALESTILLFIGLFIAYFSFQTNLKSFYPIMLLIIGSRYILFQSMYGVRLYRVLGFTLIASGTVCLFLNIPVHLGALLGGVIELIFSILIYMSHKE